MRFLTCFVLLCLVMASFAQTYTPVTADGKITIIDYGYRDWPAELVHYTVDTKLFKPGKVVLCDGAGAEVPCQIDGNVLSFVAALGKGKTATYTLAPGKPNTRLSTLRVKKDGNFLVLGNEHFTLRVPPQANKTLKTPVPAATVPAPLLGWQSAGGPWLGRTRFVTERPVRGYQMTVLRNSPACVVYEARYRFAPVGEYVCRIQLNPGLDRAEITEEFDFDAITEGKDFLLVELHQGVTPETIGWAAGEGGTLDRKPFADFMAAKLKDGTNAPAPVPGGGAMPLPPRPEPAMTLLEKILPGGKWGGTKGGVGITAPNVRVGITPLHVGAWRRAMAFTAWHAPESGLVLALPISVRNITWYAEITDDRSPFSTHEHDEGVKNSYGRRQWALYFGEKLADVQRTVGHLGLDNYKEWVLDWPETAGAAAYPRAWFTKDDIARLKKTLAQHPDRAMLEKYYVFSGNIADAERNGKQVVNHILSQQQGLGNWSVYGLSHYRQSESLTGTHWADDALACPDLTPERRKEIRRALAVGAYLLADPDLNPRGVGIHLGNNNMSINRTCALAFYAGLLPDHPRAKYWMNQVTAHVRYKLATQTGWDGPFIECPTYQLYGPIRFLDDATTIIRNTGGPDLSSYIAPNIRYLANLTMPDPRVDGRRIIPGMGNSSNLLESIFGVTLNTVEKADPVLAGQMKALHLRCWPTDPVANLLANHPEKAFRYLPDVPAKEMPLTTTIIPTYGVMFRAHYGSPDETGLLFRTGINWSHWDTDANNTVLYSKGAPLSPGTGYQYYYGPAMENNAIYHNRVKVGRYDLPELFGRVDNAITDYGFGPHADYAVASRYYPPELFDEFKDGTLAKKGTEMAWNRHVLFLKSAQPAGANYFVMRDTFPGGANRPTWWTWMNLDGAEKIAVNGTAFAAASTPFNKRVPVEQMPSAVGNTVEMATAYGAGTHFWFAGDPLTIRTRLTFDYPQGGRHGLRKEQFPKLADKEVKTIVEAMAKPGADYFYLVYPHKAGEAVPQAVKLGEGAMKVTTSEATDYVFISDTPLNVQAEGVLFTGAAGSVRVFPDRVVFAMNAGSGKIGYQGHTFEGNGPFERTVKTADLKAGTYAVNETFRKVRQQTPIGDGITVEGEGPFAAKLDGRTIRITTDGRARVLYLTQPSWIWRPQYWIDGREWMACWTDYPGSGWGRMANTWRIALSVPAGKHELIVKDLTFPAVWERKFTPTIPGVMKDAVPDGIAKTTMPPFPHGGLSAR
jgi:hypothetical protein